MNNYSGWNIEPTLKSPVFFPQISQICADVNYLNIIYKISKNQ